MNENTCSRCDETKPFDMFIKRRNICKECANSRKKEQYKALVIDDQITMQCISCNEIKSMPSFIPGRNTCKDCNNVRRRTKYQTDDAHRLVLIQQATTFKQNKAIERRQSKLAEIGENNKKCSCCNAIKSKEYFRHNRLKCKDCERDEPLDKFKRNVRSRIYIALRQNKEMHTIKYLGSTSIEYLQWITKYDDKYNLENHGKEWHIDHVIPISRFNLEDKAEQLIAFNWRNTMPLSVKENLSKNKRIIKSQIEQHLTHLTEYHTKYNIEMPQIYIDLFAKHLVAGSPLEPLLPLNLGNLGEDLG